MYKSRRYRRDEPVPPPVVPPPIPLPNKWEGVAMSGLTTAVNTLAATLVSGLSTWGIDSLRDKFEEPKETPEAK